MFYQSTVSKVCMDFRDCFLNVKEKAHCNILEQQSGIKEREWREDRPISCKKPVQMARGAGSVTGNATGYP